MPRTTKTKTTDPLVILEQMDLLLKDFAKAVVKSGHCESCADAFVEEVQKMLRDGKSEVLECDGGITPLPKTGSGSRTPS